MSQLQTQVGHIVFAIRWLLLVTLGWMFKKGGAGSGGGGGGVTWANDLAGSSNTHQWLAAISGMGGAGGHVPVADSTYLDFVTTGAILSTSGRLNFGSNLTQVLLAQRNVANSADDTVVGVAGDDKHFGSYIYGNTYLWGATQVAVGNTAYNGIVINGSNLSVGTSTLATTIGGSGGLTVDTTTALFTGTSTTFDATSPVEVDAYVACPVATPPASPAESVLLGTIDASETAAVLTQHSANNMETVLAPLGDSAKAFIDRACKEVLGVAGGGGTKAVTYTPQLKYGDCCAKIKVTCVGVTASGASGFSEEATCTILIDGSVASFVAAATGSTNPTYNPALDKASDSDFTSGGGTASSITLACISNSLRVTVTNEGTSANNFVVFFEVQGWRP